MTRVRKEEEEMIAEIEEEQNDANTTKKVLDSIYYRER